MKSFDFLSIFQSKLEELGYVLDEKADKNDDIDTQWRVYTSDLCKYDFFIQKTNKYISASVYKKKHCRKGNKSASERLIYLIMFDFDKQCFLEMKDINNRKLFLDKINKITDYYFSKVEEIRKNM